MKTYCQFLCLISPEMANEIKKESSRLNITKVELFRQMWELYKKTVKPTI